MIIIGFLLDYLVMLLFPFNSYFFLYNIEKNKLFSVILVSILLDLMYLNIYFTVFNLSIYFVVKMLRIKEKYMFYKNIFLYVLFFNITYFIGNSGNYIWLFSFGLVTYLIYIFFVIVYKKLR